MSDLFPDCFLCDHSYEHHKHGPYFKTNPPKPLGPDFDGDEWASCDVPGCECDGYNAGLGA